MESASLTCLACFRRSAHALITAHSTLHTASSSSCSLPRATISRASSSRAALSVSRFAVRSSSTSVLRPRPGDTNGHADPNKVAHKALIAQGTARRSTAVDELTDRQKHNLRSELKWLTDPLKLANHIKHVLEHDDIEKALALCRLSSRAVANVVSWNHVIDWYMGKGRTVTALEAYNEMKKRAQRPDSYTYLLLLRGLANHAHHPHSLGRALSLYHSMSAPGNKAAPAIRHTNAVLKVCARANDMDSLWDIASRLPERGPHAADNLTFTTVLNNLRLHAINGGMPAEETDEQTARRRDKSVAQGRRLWDLVTRRWRAGDLRIDEELACAMGRLLLVSSRPNDWDDVLSLVEQTMSIPRVVPRLGTEARKELGLPHIRAPGTPADMKRDMDPSESPSTSQASIEVENSRQSNGLFAQSDFQPEKSAAPTTRKSLPHAYAKPSNSTLSLVLEACLKMAGKKPATEYWYLLTNPKDIAIMPDLDNVHMRLRILRQSHSSTEVAQVLRRDLSAAKLKPMKKTFAIAMAACARDSRNISAVDAAAKVLDLSLQYLGEASAKTLKLYLDTVEAVANVAEKTPPASTSGVGSDGLENVRSSVQVQLRALARLEPGTVPLKSMINFGADPRDQPPSRSRADWDDEIKRERADAIDLMKRMIAVYDRVLSLCHGREREMGLKASDRRLCVERKNKLQAFVQRQHKNAVSRVMGSKGWRGVGKPVRDGEERKTLNERDDGWVEVPKEEREAVGVVW